MMAILMVGVHDLALLEHFREKQKWHQHLDSSEVLRLQRMAMGLQAMM